MLIGLIIFVVVICIFSVIFIFYDKIALIIEKIFFRFSVGRTVYKIAKDNDYYLLNKVAIYVDGKTVHFDHLLFGNKYIYCIGLKYCSLAINGKPNDQNWFQYKKNDKFSHIKNPMKLHRERVNYFSSQITSPKDLFVATIIINDSCLIEDTGLTHDKVINLSKFSQLVKEYESRKDVDVIDPLLLHQLVQDVYKNGVERK